MRLVDLSHPISDGMVTYPGLPGPEISDHLSFDASVAHYAAGTEFSIGRITMVANTGTYLDTPAHRYREGHDLAGLPLERCVQVPAVVVDVDGTAIGPEALPDAVAGRAVLLRTGWDRHWGTDRYRRQPVRSKECEMVIVAGHLVVAAADRDTQLLACRPVVEQARRAPGCLDFSITADLLVPGRINVFERWASQSELEAFREGGPSDEQAAAVVSASVAEYDVTGERSLTG